MFPIPPEAYRFSDIVFDVDTPASGRHAEDTWDDVSPRFVLDYKVTPNVMMFGSVAKGYKAGGYNSVEVGSRVRQRGRVERRSGREEPVPGRGRGAERVRVLLHL